MISIIINSSYTTPLKSWVCLAHQIFSNLWCDSTLGIAVITSIKGCIGKMVCSTHFDSDSRVTVQYV